MPKFTFATGHIRALSKTHRLPLVGVAGLGAAVLALSLVPGNGQATAEPATVPASAVAFSQDHTKTVQAGVAEQVADATAKAKAAAEAKKKAEAAEAKKKAEAAAKKKAEQERAKKEAASRSAARAEAKAVAKTYPNNLDGWIRESLDIMAKHKIPGTYDGLYRNIIRESSGNPNAINNWDINAQNGVPSIGLLQVIKPTFDAYHVPGTAWSQYDPVANITAAANYAADRYGSIDNVNGPY
ncbi:transglycosylase SLT domain-containing protein [Streptomyces sp. NPDC002845]